MRPYKRCTLKLNSDLIIPSQFFSDRPDKQMLESLFELLSREEGNTDPIFVLSPTSVVHTYCRRHSECGDDNDVKKFVNLLEDRISVALGKDLYKRTNREKVFF